MNLIPIKRIHFYKKDQRWYADIPGHDEADNEMIDGSDDVLELLCGYVGNENELYIDVSTKKHLPSPIIKIGLQKLFEDEEGATYRIARGTLVRSMKIKDESCWMCNVTKDVFGCFPESINIIHIL